MVRLTDVAFPSLWLFFVGFLLALGLVRTRRRNDDVREDWTRLVRFNERFQVVHATGGTDQAARIECTALARALDEFLDPPHENVTLESLVARYAPGEGGWNVGDESAAATAEAIRVRILQIDRELQRRMKESAKQAGHVGRVFLAGVGGLLVAPLELARRLGLVRRLSARRVEESPWYHATLGIALFGIGALTLLAGIRLTEAAKRAAAAAGLGP